MSPTTYNLEPRTCVDAKRRAYPPMADPAWNLSFHCPLARDPWLNERVVVAEGRALYDNEPELLLLGWRRRQVDGTGTGSRQLACFVLPLRKLDLRRWSQAPYVADLLLQLYFANNPGCSRRALATLTLRVKGHRKSHEGQQAPRTRPRQVLSPEKARARYRRECEQQLAANTARLLGSGAQP